MSCLSGLEGFMDDYFVYFHLKISPKMPAMGTKFHTKNVEVLSYPVQTKLTFIPWCQKFQMSINSSGRYYMLQQSG